MKPVIRYRSQLLFRRAYKPNPKHKPGLRVPALLFRPARVGPNKESP